VVVLRGCDPARSGCDADELLYAPLDGTDAAAAAAAIDKSGVLAPPLAQRGGRPGPVVGFWSHRFVTPHVPKTVGWVTPWAKP